MKRILSVCLTCALLLGMLPLPALALEPDSEGLCPHHTEHSYEVCGYMEAVEGQPCGHVHDGRQSLKSGRMSPDKRSISVAAETRSWFLSALPREIIFIKICLDA